MDRRTFWTLIGLVALGAAIRFATLDLQGFHHDEAVTAGQVLDPSLTGTLDQAFAGERSPPLYYVLAWAWSSIFGIGEVGLRSLSALIGTAMIPAAFFAGRHLASERVGLAAALFFALNPYLVWYSQEARSYVLMALFVTVSIGALASWSNERQSRRLWLWAGAGALALLSHYFAIFLVAPQVLWLIVREQQNWRRVLAPIGAIALVGLLLIPLALNQQGEERRDGFTERPVLERAAETGLNFVASEEPDPLTASSKVDALQVTAGVSGLALALLAVGLALRLPAMEKRRVLELSALASISVLLPVLLAFAGLDLLNPRNALATAVPLLLTAAVIFGSPTGCLAQLLLIATAALFAAVTLAFNLSAEMQREDWRGAAVAMGETDAPRIIVAPKNGDDPLEFYLDATKFEGGRFSDGVEVSELQVLTAVGVASPPSGFASVRSERLPPLFLLETFTAAQPRSVAPEDLAGVIDGRAVVLIDR